MSKIGIKFVQGGKVFTFDDNDLEIKENEKVVVETIRGIEIGIACKCSDEPVDDIKPVLRIATDEDIEKAEELRKQEPRVRKITNELIDKYKLDMKLVDISFTLDGSKVIINYICEDRVDFRELVKDLASQLKQRIELRQIGIRDQAKSLGGIGFCGKECCCKKYLNDFDKVSIKMAKTQGLSLNPTKISGICGRLMCCLSYENDFYSEVSSQMPKINSKVKTKDGEGIVVYNNLLKQKVTVRIESDNEIKVNEYELQEVESLNKIPTPQKVEQKSKEKNQNNNLSQKSTIEPLQNKEEKPFRDKKFNKFKKNNKNELKR